MYRWGWGRVEEILRCVSSAKYVRKKVREALLRRQAATTRHEVSRAAAEKPAVTGDRPKLRVLHVAHGAVETT